MSKHEKVTCIIQARTRSERLPNKVLKEIENLPMICHIINRVKKAKNIDQIILATSNTDTDKILLDIAKKFDLNFAQISIKFCEIQKFLTSVIIGATTMEQLKINIESVSVNLKEEILKEINDVQIKYPNPCP